MGPRAQALKKTPVSIRPFTRVASVRIDRTAPAPRRVILCLRGASRRRPCGSDNRRLLAPASGPRKHRNRRLRGVGRGIGWRRSFPGLFSYATSRRLRSQDRRTERRACAPRSRTSQRVFGSAISTCCASSLMRESRLSGRARRALTGRRMPSRRLALAPVDYIIFWIWRGICER